MYRKGAFFDFSEHFCSDFYAMFGVSDPCKMGNRAVSDRKYLTVIKCTVFHKTTVLLILFPRILSVPLAMSLILFADINI